MLGRDRSVWIEVTHALEALAANGRAVWTEPPAVQKALGELLGVFPATHVQVNLSALFRPGDGKEDWASLLSRSGQWGALLSELALAIAGTVRASLVWGIGLPGPQQVAAALGDASERGVLKAGIQLASFLQAFREARLGFVTIDTRGVTLAAIERAIAPICRNSAMYGWQRAVCVDNIAAAGSLVGADLALVSEASLADLRPLWEVGRKIGGGLSQAFWNNAALEENLPSPCPLYGEVPEGITPKAIVEAGRTLRARL